MRTDTVLWARRILMVIIVLAIILGGAAAWGTARQSADLDSFLAGFKTDRSQDASSNGPLAFLPRLVESLLASTRPHIGIVAGHSGHDSGAVCPDGLTEAEVNKTIAKAVVKTLEERGVRVDLLEEFDPRLQGYQADAFVSIHADSCQVTLTGFKVASLEGGSEASVRLTECLWNEYEKATGLPRHPNTITYDMSRYHAFREIAASTPAAIIETGFLRADRELLTKGSDRVAAGIVAGIECFLAEK